MSEGLPPDVVGAIKEMITVDGTIKKLEEALKKFKDRKSILQNKIENHMRTENVRQINLPGGEKLQTYVRKSRAGVTKKWISTRLETYCSSHNLNYQEIYDFIYDPTHRPQVEKKTIKKIKSKKKFKK